MEEAGKEICISDDPGLLQRTRTLCSLAILKVDIDEHHRTYSDYLIRFILHVLTTRKPDIVTDKVIADLLESEFGLKVPLKVVQHVLRRMVRQEYLIKENNVFFPRTTLKKIDISAKRLDAENKIQGVYDAICKLAPTIKADVQWANSDAAAAIVGFLSRFAVDCLKTYVFNTALPKVPETGPKELYIVSRFLQNAYDHNRALFEDFIVLVKGQMYANALTCPDLESLARTFGDVTFYVDTPLVLNLLGLQGDVQKQAAEELTTLLYDLKGTLAVFHHTLEEIKGVIRFTADHLEDPRMTNRILREARNSGTSLSDLILCHDQLDERLSLHNIRIIENPPYDKSFQIDEIAFKSVLEDEIRYFSQHALSHDVNSVRGIYVIRKGLEPFRLEDARAVIVTTNSDFAKAAFEFGKSHNSSREISPVITDYSLANVAWLKAPMKRPLLPEKETLAFCYAALEPPKELFKKYVEMMDSLKEKKNISEEEHAILRMSPMAHKELMDLTLGEERALTGASLRDILSRVKESLIDEQKKVSAEERTKIEEQLKILTRTYKDKEESLTKEYQTSEEEKARLKADQSNVLSVSLKRAKSLSRVLTVCIMAVFSGLLLVAAAAGCGLITAQTFNSAIYKKAILPFFVFIAVGWGWYSWVSGKTIRNITEKFEQRLTMKFYTWLTGKRASSE